MKMKRIGIILFLITFLSFLSFPQQLVWQHTAGPMGGVVGGMDINSNGDIYAGVYPFLIGYIGLYKSTNNGDAWNKVETQFEDFQVFSVFVTREDHIWVGTDHQGTLYRSTDNGQTWEIKTNGYLAFEGWAFGESNDGVLFAGDANMGKLFRSTDNGENWEFSANIAPLAFAADSNNVVYAGSFNGLYSTTDNGITWTQNNFLSSFAVSTVLVDSGNNIYCGTGYSFVGGDGLFSSDDGGQNWTQIGLAGKAVLALAFDSEGSLFAGTLKDGLFKTTNMGKDWRQYQKGLYSKEVYRLEINQQDDIFIGSEGGGKGWHFYKGGGVFRSTNGGNSFEQIGLPISLVENIVFSGDSLVVTSTPSGVQKYNRFTKKWKNLGLHNVEAVTITPSNYLYAATRDEGLFKSTDLGESWLITNLTGDTLMPVHNVLAANDDTLFAGVGFGLNLRRSTNGGQDWDVLSIRTSESLHGLFLYNGNLWVTGASPGYNILYKTSNYGVSFDSLYSGFDSNVNNPISATSSGYVFLASRGGFLDGVIRSTDVGLTWEQILFKQITPVVFSNDNGIVITSSDSIHLSNNYGNTWTNFTQPISGGYWHHFTDIKQNPVDEFFFGTSTKGLYEVDIVTNVEEESLDKYNFLLSQNYPNPFNPTTTIRYSILKPGMTSLKVYDILGKEVVILVNEAKLAGNYSVKFNTSHLASGIYFYRLRAGNFVETKKMILLK
jgi:photosystem II stability/assembly factor-like uncharacterized protein